MVNKTVKRAKSCGASKYSESEIVLKFIQILNILFYITFFLSPFEVISPHLIYFMIRYSSETRILYLA